MRRTTVTDRRARRAIVAEGGRLLGALLLLGCTADNPAYQPPSPTSLDADVGVADLRDPATPPDLAPPPPDLALCRSGDRRCRDGDGGVWVSQLCGEGRWRDDRRCPVNAGCGDGYCQAPPRSGEFEGKPCQRENDCFNPMQPSTNVACTPFVDPGSKMIEGYCAQQISRQGTGFPGTPCRPADGSVCRSGFCDEVTRSFNGRDINFCFRACEVDNDCPGSARFCRDAVITVEQVGYKTGKSCVPTP